MDFAQKIICKFVYFFEGDDIYVYGFCILAQQQDRF